MNKSLDMNTPVHKFGVTAVASINFARYSERK